jgi:hypothetical protein
MFILASNKCKSFNNKFKTSKPMKTEKKWTNSEDNFLIKKNASVFSTYKSISTLENKDQKSKQNS